LRSTEIFAGHKSRQRRYSVGPKDSQNHYRLILNYDFPLLCELKPSQRGRVHVNRRKLLRNVARPVAARFKNQNQGFIKSPEDELKARVETIQERTFKLRNMAMDVPLDLIKDLKAVKGAGKTDGELVAA